MYLFKIFRLFRKEGADKSKTPDQKPKSMIGRLGKTLTPLRCYGFIEVDGKQIEVMSSTGFIPRGRLVKIIEKRMGWYLVEPTT